MPADTFSTDGVGLLLMGTGNDNNLWGSNLNTNVFQIIADALANPLTETVTGGTLDLSASPPPSASSQTHYAGIIFNGVLGSPQSIIVPNLNKWWYVSNQTSGAFALTMKTSGGAPSTPIPQNSQWQIIQCDGNNNIVVWPNGTKQLQMPDGTAAAPPFSNINETNSGWHRNGTQDWRLSINGNDVLQVTGPGAGTPSVVNILAPNVLQASGVQIVPSGVEAPFAGINAPAGWLLEFGQAISRSAAANVNLFNAITLTLTGTTHGTTTIDGLSTDLRGLGLIGANIEGTGIAAGRTITAIASATSMTVSGAVTGSATITLRILPFGQGDYNGTVGTTFNVPDRRGRALFGRDDMGGTAAGVLSLSRPQGINGTKLGTAGGEQAHTLVTAELATHGHIVTVTDPTHQHTIPDPGHNHTIPDPGHVHGVVDPGHIHGVGDPSHVHNISFATTVTNAGAGGAFAYVSNVGVGANTGTTQAANTGVSVLNHISNISISLASTGITSTDVDITNITVTDFDATGITAVANLTGSSTPFNVVPPGGVTNYIIKL